ncbi:MAG: winged helix-turn-helix transcriptional regulator [Candidatus Zambryskibacteria bacterium]|nr:winged helix-turn-helix transcriptional regulator [Candidatus Zambryskibacteria bacterium]
MADESTIEDTVSETTPGPEPVIETSPVQEPIPEPQITEPAQTAQPVEPLNPEPTAEPQPIPEPTPEPSIAPVEPVSAPDPVQPPQASSEPIPGLTPTPEPTPILQPQNSTPPAIQTSLARELLVRAREMIQFRKRKKLEKIMSLFLKKQAITNDDIQKLLYISDATATRYFKQLETKGRIRRQGVPGHASYSRI